LVLGEGKYRLSTAVGSLREVVVKDGAPEEIAPAFGSNELFVQALAKNTKLPAGTKAEVIDLTT